MNKKEELISKLDPNSVRCTHCTKIISKSYASPYTTENSAFIFFYCDHPNCQQMLHLRVFDYDYRMNRLVDEDFKKINRSYHEYKRVD